MEKIINHVVLTVSLSLKERETPSGKPLLHKDESSLEKRYTCNCGDEVGMLSYLQGLTWTEISMAVNQYARFWNDPCLVSKCAIRRIAKCLTSMSKYVDLPEISNTKDAHLKVNIILSVDMTIIVNPTST